MSYSDHYAEQGIFSRPMDRLRAIRLGEKGFVPVIAAALRCGTPACINPYARLAMGREQLTGGQGEGISNGLVIRAQHLAQPWRVATSAARRGQACA